MKKNQKLALIVVIIVIAIAAAWYALKHRSSITEVSPNAVLTEEMQLKLDREALKNPKATPNQIYGAMIRLSQKKEDIAHDEALKRSTDENPFLRGGAAQALGYFDDQESMDTLKKLLNDKDKSVQLFAIQGLGAKADHLRQQELEQLLKSSGSDPMMQVEIYSSLLKAGSDSAKQTALENLIKIAKQSDDDAATEACQRLITLAPDNNQVLDLIRHKISAAKNERVTAVGTRYLASRNDPWIKPVLKTLSNHPSAIIRAAVVQSLHRVCPTDRWEILQDMFDKENDQSVLKLILEEPMYLMGNKAIDFSTKAASSNKLSPDMKKIAEDTRDKVQASNSEELCERQK